MRPHGFCNNCGKNGHSFHQCRQPITSLGVIAVRYGARGIEILMIRRKDSLGYVDFMRGKYPLNSVEYIQNIVDGMTNEEKERLLSSEFDEMWTLLWGQPVGTQYRSEERTSREKLSALTHGIVVNGESYSLSELVEGSSTRWDETEWGFPKGRRNYQERDWTAASREFEEETGYSARALTLVDNLLPLEEIFTGSNYKSYKHKYYVALLDPRQSPVREPQKTEVSKVQWMTPEEAYEVIRPYNVEKRAVVSALVSMLGRYRIYA